MKKLVVTGAMLAIMVMGAPAAFADHAVGGDVTIDVVDASQSQAAAAWQSQRGDAGGGGGNANAAAIEQSFTIDQSEVNGGWGGVAASGDISWWD